MFARTISYAAGAFAVVLSLSAAVLADEAEGAKACIQLNRISNVKVIDNQNIRFEMNGGVDYMNTLPNKCPGLSKHKPIMYKTSINKLCDLDIITVLDSVGGGYSRGGSCGLGKFVPMEDDQPAE